jgi:hypothetical protein
MDGSCKRWIELRRATLRVMPEYRVDFKGTHCLIPTLMLLFTPASPPRRNVAAKEHVQATVVENYLPHRLSSVNFHSVEQQHEGKKPSRATSMER